MTTDMLMEALDGIIWYNGFYEQMQHWEALIDQAERNGEWVRRPEFPEDMSEQLEIFWMLLVLLYGNYGTSPRSGWIEDLVGARRFIRRICKTSREAEEHVY